MYTVKRSEEIMAKRHISIRLSERVIAYFSSLGFGYQVAINDVLENYVTEKENEADKTTKQ